MSEVPLNGHLPTGYEHLSGSPQLSPILLQVSNTQVSPKSFCVLNFHEIPIHTAGVAVRFFDSRGRVV